MGQYLIPCFLTFGGRVLYRNAERNSMKNFWLNSGTDGTFSTFFLALGHLVAWDIPQLA